MGAHRYGTDHIPCSRGACAMATVQSTLSRTPVQNNVDLLRRYCPALAVHTHAQVAAHIVGSATGCWPWDGSITEAGYAYVSCEPTPYGASQCVPVHRHMHAILLGQIPYRYDIP